VSFWEQRKREQERKRKGANGRVRWGKYQEKASKTLFGRHGPTGVKDEEKGEEGFPKA